MYYYIKKLFLFIISILILSLIVFYVARLAPGDPLVSYYGDRVEKMSVQERHLAEKKLALNKPIYIQYLHWLSNALHGEFGISFKYKRDVLEVIGSRMGNTLLLGGVGFIIIFIISLLIGILCAWYEDRWIDKIFCKIGTIVSCIPEFWLSLVLILIFAVSLQILPSSGAYSINILNSQGKLNNLKDRIIHLILPMTVLILNHFWYYAYMIRNKMIEEVHADYVLLAKSKGLNKRKIMFSHCLRNSISSYLSIMAISIPHILGGTYIVETVFSYPGIGMLFYESVRYQDYNLLMILSMLSGVVVILCNILVQIINERINPRINKHEVIEMLEVDEVG